MIDERQVERSFRDMTKGELESRIAEYADRLDGITGRTERMKHDPEAVLREDKQAQLEEVLSAYGKVDCRTLSIEQIALTFVRLQGEEKVVRQDIAKLSAHENTKELKKNLAIAQRILAEKQQHGGRA